MLAATAIVWIKRIILFPINFQLFLCLVVLLSGNTYGQSEIRFQRITVDDGLSQSSITSMVQDKFGYLWIGTLDGLNRYDGTTFTIYRNEKKPTSLPTNSISELFLDGQDRLWVTYRNGLSLYDPAHNNFKNFKLQGQSAGNLFIRNLQLVSDSLIQLCTNWGVYLFNPLKGTIRKDKEFEFFGDRSVAFLSKSENSIWFATDSALWRRRSGEKLWLKIFDAGERIRVSFFENSNELYARTSSKLLKYNNALDELVTIADIPTDQWPASESLFKTPDGHLWVAHGEISVFNKLDQFQYKLQHVSNDPNSLSGAFVSRIYQTKDGVIWVGTNGLGLNKYDPYRSVFNYLGNFPGAEVTLSDNFVNSISEDTEGNLMINTLDGLNLINLEKRKSFHLPVIAKNGTRAQVQKVIYDTGQRIWFGTTKGVMRFSGRTVNFSGNKLLDDPTLRVFDIINAENSNFILATSKYILHWNPFSNEVKVLNPFGSEVLQRINGQYWIESGDALMIFDISTNLKIKEFPKNGSDSLHAPLASVKCITQDSQGNIWIGTSGGGFSLYNAIEGSFTHFTDRDGLANNVVYGILEDRKRNLWLSTNKGISVFNTTTKAFVRHFNKSDGLQSNEFNTRAYYRSASGKLYFGGVNGLTFFDPEEALSIPVFLPKTIVTGVYINNERQDQETNPQVAKLYSHQSIELNWNQRNFSFDIAGLGFTFPGGMQHQYLLEGYDRTWHNLGNQERITFTNMNAGNYVLRVKSGNASGQWEEPGIAIQIRISAPLWRTWWFLAMVVTAFVLLVVFMYYQRILFLKRRAAWLQSLVEERTREIQVQREEIAAQNEELNAQAEILERTNAELEKRVEDRTRRLKQLNEELIDQNTQLEQFTFITAHNIRGPIARIKGLVMLLKPDNLHEMIAHLETCVKNLDEVIADLNVILNITHGVDKKFELVRVKEQLELVINILGNEIELKHGKVDTIGFSDVQILGFKPYFQSIFYNLIHNAIKYAEPSRKLEIKCSAEQTTDAVKIVVEDNGIGIDMRYAKDKIFKLHQRFHTPSIGKGFGLYLVKTQVRAMGGKIEVESELNVGTRFEMQFPLKPENQN